MVMKILGVLHLHDTVQILEWVTIILIFTYYLKCFVTFFFFFKKNDEK